jgi:hypothetical protein
MFLTIVENSNAIRDKGRVLEADEGQEVAAVDHLDQLKGRTQVSTLLELQWLSGKDLKALTGRKSNAAVVPVKGYGVYYFELVLVELLKLFIHLGSIIKILEAS